MENFTSIYLFWFSILLFGKLQTIERHIYINVLKFDFNFSTSIIRTEFLHKFLSTINFRVEICEHVNPFFSFFYHSRSFDHDLPLLSNREFLFDNPGKNHRMWIIDSQIRALLPTCIQPNTPTPILISLIPLLARKINRHSNQKNPINPRLFPPLLDRYK